MTISRILFILWALGTKFPHSCFKLLKDVDPQPNEPGQQEEGLLKTHVLELGICSSLAKHLSARHETLSLATSTKKTNILAGQTDTLKTKVI